MINCDYESGSCRLSKYCVLIMVFVWFVFIVVLIWKLRNPKNYPRTSYTPSIIQLYWPRPGITLYTTTLILIVTDIAGLAASLQPTFCKWLLQYWSNVATKIDMYGNMVWYVFTRVQSSPTIYLQSNLNEVIHEDTEL